MSQPQWKLRLSKNEDIPLLFSSWLKSYRDAPSMTAISNTIYYDCFHRALESILSKAAIVIVCDPEDEETVFGYGVAESKGDTLVIHWVYTKHSFRGHGVGKAVEEALLQIPHKRVIYTCRTRLTDTFNKTRNYTYNPFLLWSHVNEN